MWEEVETAKSGNRRELVLQGEALIKRFGPRQEIDPNLFKLVSLNFLELSGCPDLNKIPEDVGNLSSLSTLIMNGTGVAEIPGAALLKLQKLKVLTLSKNKITACPAEVGQIQSLTTLNLSMNALTEMPSLDQCPQLAHVHLSGNQITDLGFLCNDNLKLLAEVDVSKNKIADLPHEISLLVALKKFDVSENALKSVPGELSDCLRMKDLILGSNPLSDNRLKKMVDQKGTKAVMDYIRQHGERAGGAAGGGGGGGGGKKGKGKKGKKGNSGDVDTTTDMDAIIDRIDVLHMRDGSPEIVVHESVKAARPYIVCFIVRDLDLSEAAKFKSFIQLQTKLHETVCAKRNAATIATHDLSKVPAGNLDYIAVEPGLLEIVPLNKKTPFKAVDLVKHLRDEAEAVRKAKKRTTISGIHQYLNLLKDKAEYACLKDSSGKVISFPPITNSEDTKIEPDTTSLLVEVTSSTKLADAKNAADALIQEMLNGELGKKSEGGDAAAPPPTGKQIVIEQVKIVDADGHHKVTYPSKTDVQFERAGLVINRP